MREAKLGIGSSGTPSTPGFRRARPQVKAKPDKPANQEVYGLDIGFLEDLGLGDILGDLSDGGEPSKDEKSVQQQPDNQIDSASAAAKHRRAQTTAAFPQTLSSKDIK